MPYDPSKPAPGDDLDAVLMRNQLNGLKEIIDAIPATISAAVDAAVAAALAGTSANSNGVGTLNLAASPGYDAAQVQVLASKLDELITALRR